VGDAESVEMDVAVASYTTLGVASVLGEFDIPHNTAAMAMIPIAIPPIVAGLIELTGLGCGSGRVGLGRRVVAFANRS